MFYVAGGKQRSKIIVKEVANALNGHIARGVGRQYLWIVGIVPLFWKNRSHSRAPDFLDGGQDAQLVVHQHVMLRRVTVLNVFQFLFLMHINQHMAIHGLR